MNRTTQKHLESAIRSVFGWNGYSLHRESGVWSVIEDATNNRVLRALTKNALYDLIWAAQKGQDFRQKEVDEAKRWVDKLLDENQALREKIARLELLEASLDGVNARPARKL